MATPPFPMNPAPFSGNSRTAEAGACFDWLRQAWAMFSANPGVWVGAAVILLVFYLALHIVPFVGRLVANLLLPALLAGLLAMCRKQSQGEEIALSDILLGFQGKPINGLIIVGGLLSAAVLLIVLLAGILAGGSLIGGAMMARPAGIGVAFGGVLLGLLLALALSVPVSMAVWFAPALVHFHDMPPVDALKASFHACTRNWLSLLVYSLIMSVAFFFSLLPVGLGLLLFVPIVIGTLYASYRDIFPGS